MYYRHLGELKTKTPLFVLFRECRDNCEKEIKRVKRYGHFFVLTLNIHDMFEKDKVLVLLRTEAVGENQALRTKSSRYLHDLC